jgi:exonuclease SbcC
MIPIELELHNFLAYRDPGSLRFEGIHIACLAGPNGAGKSSLLDAITWALWGKARVNAPDELIHQGQKEMRVVFTFEQETTRFRVLRQRKSGKRGASLLELQVWNPEVEDWQGISEKTMRATQRKIDGLLRLDYETFVNSAFLVQGKADEFTKKTPGQRKQVLANILGLSRWDSYEMRAKERITETKAALHRLDGRLEEIERELSQRDGHIAELNTAEEAAREAEGVLSVEEKKWSTLEQTRNELVTLQRQIDDLTRRITSTTKEVEEAERESVEAQAQADETALRAALEELQATLKGLESVQQGYEENRKGAALAAEETAHLEGINQALAPETEPIKTRAATLRSAIEPVCPTCGQPLTEEHRAKLLVELEQDVEQRREQYRTNRERILELKGQIQSLEREGLSLDSKLKERPGLLKRAGELEQALEQASGAAERGKNLQEKITRWSKELEADRELRSTIEDQAEASEKQLHAASLTQADVDRLRLAKRMADERVGGARQKLSALEAFEKQREERLEDRRRLAENLGLYEDLREAFGKRGVPAMIIETAVPELERAANDLIQRLTDSRMNVRIETQREIKTGEVREALDIIISDDLGSRSYELYSGGEAFRINFAIRIALSRLLARRAGAQLRSLFIDEGFGTQDAQGREHLVAAINSIQDDFDRILVITHIDELKEAFPTRIEVSKTPEGSVFRLT